MYRSGKGSRLGWARRYVGCFAYSCSLHADRAFFVVWLPRDRAISVEGQFVDQIIFIKKRDEDLAERRTSALVQRGVDEDATAWTGELDFVAMADIQAFCVERMDFDVRGGDGLV